MEEILVKKKNKNVILTIIIGLILSCVGVFAMFSSFNYSAKAEGETTAMIVVDAGASTDITGGTVGAMENGNSIYVADTGILNMTGGTVEGNIYNAGTFNYTAGSVASVTLASGKYITFKGAPTTAISITLDNPAVGANVGYLSGITKLDLTLLSVTNLPINSELVIVNGWVQIASTIRQVSITASEYGNVDVSSLSVVKGETITVEGSTLTYGSSVLTATPIEKTAQYTYSFDGFYVGSTKITDSYTVTADTVITAIFTKAVNNYLVSILSSNSNYGRVSTASVEVSYGTTYSSDGTILTIGDTTITATTIRNTASEDHYFSSWSSESGTITADTTITATFTAQTYSTCTIRFVSNNIAYGSVSTISATVRVGHTISMVSGNTIKLSFSDVSITVTATANEQDEDYNYSFVRWSTSSTGSSEFTGGDFSSNTTIYAIFSAQALYNVTFSSGANTFFTHNVVALGATATWGSDGLDNNQEVYTVSGNVDFFINYTIPATKTTSASTTELGTQTTYGVAIKLNGELVASYSSSSTAQFGTYNFTTSSATTVEISLRSTISSFMGFDAKIKSEYDNNHGKEYVILNKRQMVNV